MTKLVLITGGAGFIGRSVARELLSRGYDVRVLDTLIEQVHSGERRPADLDSRVELVIGDVRDPVSVRRALANVDAVVHLAAEVGVGQSMYAISRYTSANDMGTAILFEQLLEAGVRRVVTASSMSIYGEGLYRSLDGRLFEDVQRPGDFLDPVDGEGRALIPVPTPESKRPALASIYAIGKYVQERMTLTLTEAYGMEGVALRLWNVYGPGQALSNPYTGVLAIFSSRLAAGHSPLVFEDGRQQRDFVHVRDVARAFAQALVRPEATGKAINIASGEPRTIESVARDIALAMGRDIEPIITGERRAGDIRHCLADISLARTALGYEPQEDFPEGLAELAEWVARQTCEDRAVTAWDELAARGLVA